MTVQELKKKQNRKILNSQAKQTELTSEEKLLFDLSKHAHSRYPEKRSSALQIRGTQEAIVRPLQRAWDLRGL